MVNWLLTETIRLLMDSVNSRFLHVWYMIGTVDSTGSTKGITPVEMVCVPPCKPKVSMGRRCGLVVERRTPERKVGGSIVTQVAMLYP